MTSVTTLTFLGATGTVTGSRFLLEHRDFRLLIDCGLFQGLKELRLRNWSFEQALESVDAIALTHAHLDHTGYVPLMVKHGFRGPVLATSATCALCGILWPDCGHLMEEDARWANKKGFSRHRPALPLYTEEEARHALAFLRPARFDGWIEVHDELRLRFLPVGHILGAAMIEVRIGSGAKERAVVFSGDLGRPDQPVIPRPHELPECEHLLLECTYGNRDHPAEDPKDALAEIVLRTAERGGVVLIPAFAVGRTQALLYLLRELQREDRLPRDIPIHVDSPMAIHAIRVFMDHPEAHDREMRARVRNGEDPLGLRNVHLDFRVEDSRALNDLNYPAIVISASGMAVGGRVLHHLAYRLPDHRTTVLFVGFQAAGTRGRALQEGARTVKIHGREVPVRARVETLDGLSAHADRGEIVDWLRTSDGKPGRVSLVHGEPEAAASMSERLRDELNLDVDVPDYREKVRL